MSFAPRVPEPGPARRGGLGRRLERASKRTLSRWLARLAPARPLSRAALAELRVRRLLVVRQHNQMGDMVCALPALHGLRRAYPDAHLTFVAAPLCEELLQGHPDLDELIVFRKFTMWLPWCLAALVHRLRHPRPDLAVVMTTVSFSTTSALLAWASGARWRVGASSLPFGWELSRAVYNLELPLGPEGLHEVEHNLAPLRAMGLVAPAERPHLVVRPEALQMARAFVQRHFGAEGDQPGPLVVVHAGAGKLANIWPTARFESALQRLQEERRARIVLLEGPNDRRAVAALQTRIEVPIWRARLGDTLGLLALADLVLCNDTGMAHVAGAVDAPTLVLFGPTDAARWKPPGEHVVAVSSPTRSLGDLDVREVLHAAVRILDERRAHSFRPGNARPA